MNDYKDVRLIGLVGKAGSGKDTLADEIAADGWEKVAFADSLKRMCIDYLGLSHDDAYTQEGKMRMNPHWGMTNRTILQKVGTDAMRNGFDKDVWVKILQIRIRKMLDEGRKVVITDCRFDNEAQMVEDMGGLVVEVVRDSQSKNLSSVEQQHASENPVSRKYVAFTIDNNGEVSRLRSLFAVELGLFCSRHPMVSHIVGLAVERGLVEDSIASRWLLDIGKFMPLSQEPDASFVMGNEIVLEWNGGGEYPRCSIVFGKDGIIFEAHSENDAKKMEFLPGDDEGWIDAMGYISEKCK